jgi:hypothetical protein
MGSNRARNLDPGNALPKLALILAWLPAALRADGEDSIAFFESKIRPLLIEHCLECHSTDTKQKGGLLLDSRAGWETGGDNGPAVVPGDPAQSLLIKAVAWADTDLQMPPKRKLAEAEIAALTEWIKRGAPDPREAEARVGLVPLSKAKSWWAFQPLHKPMVPDGAGKEPIDALIGQKLAAAGLPPAPPADRRTLLRRLTFDLTGLPPTPEEVAAFLADTSPEAYTKAVNRLLASPAYGQRWARHWLDVVRYADYHSGDPKARVTSCEPLEAWRYRDWVVDSFNHDRPFDDFIRHQIAGDLMPGPDGAALYPDGLVATGFLANGTWDRGDADKEKLVSDMVDDQIDTVGKAFLGLTLGCARCHDHKFDPVSNEDYYALAGIFYSTHFLDDIGAKGGEITFKRVPLAPPDVVALREGKLRRIEAITAKLASFDKLPRPPAADHPERRALTQERDALQAALPPAYPVAMTVQEGGQPGGLFPNIQDVPIHVRGSYTKLGPVVPRRMPTFFSAAPPAPITQGSGRRELAAWLASKDNPLTARVIVNRVWQWHFGEGLVRTPNNFGLTSEPPVHRELLDWLAAKFIADGWSLKALHRRILHSATYQQASLVPPEQAQRDPENRLLGRFASRRLEAEAIRDAMIAVSGRLDPAAGGPAGADLAVPRRSLYIQTARWDRGTFATLFDAANADASTDKRTVSTVAPQALLMLNNGFVQAQAAELAARLQREAPSDETARIELAYQLLYARPAKPEEAAICRDLLAKSGNSWRDLAHTLLCSNEFIYVD